MTPAPVTGGRAWLGAGLVVVAVPTGASTLRTLVAPGPWTATTVGTVLLVALVTTTARVVDRTRVAPTLWGLAVAAAVVASLWSSPLGPRVPLPTLGTLRGVRRTFDSGVEAIAHGHIPLTPSPGVEMLVVSGVLVVLLAADLLALALRRPGAAGLAVAALWSVAVVFERALSLPLLVLGGATFLTLLALVRPDRRTPGTRAHRRRELAGAGAAAVGVALVAALTAPLLAAVPGWGAVRLPASWGGAAATGPVRLSLDLDMRADLGGQTTRTLLTYTADGPATGPLRLYTLSTFDGRQWLRDAQEEAPEGAGDPGGLPLEGVLWPTAAPEREADDVTTLRVQVRDLDTDRLPLPLDPREVTAPPGGTWRYDPARDEVLSPDTSVRGRVYEVGVHDRDLSAEALRADVPAPVDQTSPYLQLPATPAADQVRAIALEVTAGLQSPYEQAVALQTWFRDARRFRYDTQAPEARSDDAVWDFLEDRTGYCVQYATAMTVMARHLGIPARMGVGFLPGRVTASGERIVTGRLAHTWPELWFAESGWVRFEPTPAVQTGSPPVYADPLAVDPVSPEEREQPLPTASPSPSTPAAPRTGSTTPGGEVTLGGAHVPRLLVVAVAGLLVVAVLVVRLRRPEPPPRDAEEAWSRLRRRLERRGVTWSDASTPRAVARELAERMRPAVRESAGEPLDRLTAALESVRYAPRPPDAAPEDLAAWVQAIDEAFAPVREGTSDERVRVPV